MSLSTPNLSQQSAQHKELLPPEPKAPSPLKVRKHKPYDIHKQGFLDPAKKDRIADFLGSIESDFTQLSNRKTIYFGDHNYKYGDTTHKAQKIPEPLQEVIDLIKDAFPDDKSHPNSCLISLYEDGNNCIPAHKDDELWINPTSSIYTLSLGDKRTMQFTNDNKDVANVDVELEDNSLIQFSYASHLEWKHAIVPETSKTKRYSLTLRIVEPIFCQLKPYCGRLKHKGPQIWLF